MRKTKLSDLADCRNKIDYLLNEYNCEIKFEEEDNFNEVILIDLDTNRFQIIENKSGD